jgi:hypothetical protein
MTEPFNTRPVFTSHLPPASHIITRRDAPALQ